MHRFERCQSTESIWEEPERGTFFGTTLRSTQQPMRQISWAASLCLPLPVDKYYRFIRRNNAMCSACQPVVRAATSFCNVIFAVSFLQCHFDSQNHSYFPFRSKPQHRPHSCPCRQQKCRTRGRIVILNSELENKITCYMLRFKNKYKAFLFYLLDYISHRTLIVGNPKKKKKCPENFA